MYGFFPCFLSELSVGLRNEDSNPAVGQKQ
jgi:hypothetical protein